MSQVYFAGIDARQPDRDPLLGCGNRIVSLLPIQSTLARTSGPATGVGDTPLGAIATARNRAASGGRFGGITQVCGPKAFPSGLSQGRCSSPSSAVRSSPVNSSFASVAVISAPTRSWIRG